MSARHDGTAWPPLARLKTAAGVGLVLLVIFVCFVEPDGTERPCDTATVNGNVWRREPAEVEDPFLKRVAAEASPRRPDCMALALLE